jgi:hypothetical protein
MQPLTSCLVHSTENLCKYDLGNRMTPSKSLRFGLRNFFVSTTDTDAYFIKVLVDFKTFQSNSQRKKVNDSWLPNHTDDVMSDDA